MTKATHRPSLASRLPSFATIALAAAALTAILAGTALADDRAGLYATHKGGVLRLVTNAAEGTSDPQINYTLKNWQVFQYVYDTLVVFKKADGPDSFTIVPDLAEAVPTPQDGGKTYVFKLRKGIKFSNATTASLVAPITLSTSNHARNRSCRKLRKAGTIVVMSPLTSVRWLCHDLHAYCSAVLNCPSTLASRSSTSEFKA